MEPLLFNVRPIRDALDGIPLRHVNWLVAHLGSAFYW